MGNIEFRHEVWIRQHMEVRRNRTQQDSTLQLGLKDIMRPGVRIDLK